MNYSVSIIAPVYNEVSRLLDGFNEISTYMMKHLPAGEFIIVDDGSEISAEEILLQSQYKRRVVTLIKQKKLRILKLTANQGKGAAIAYGVKEAKGKTILFTDIDCSVPIHYASHLINAVKKTQVAIGSRRVSESEIIVHQPFMRELGGRLYTVLNNVICQVNVADATCGFKAFQKNAAKKLFSKSQVDRWAFDTEILFLARKYKYSIIEVPVAWSNKMGSRVRMNDTIRAFIDLLWIRLHDIQGKYS